MPRYPHTTAIAQAIAQMEGFTSGASVIARQNNNPGNIRYWGPSYQMRGGFTAFPSLAEGWAALHELVDDYTAGPQGQPAYFSHYPTLLEIFTKYAPGSDGNNPQQYAQYVGQQIGMPINVPVATYAGGNPGTTNTNTEPVITLPTDWVPSDVPVGPDDQPSDVAPDPMMIAGIIAAAVLVALVLFPD